MLHGASAVKSDERLWNEDWNRIVTTASKQAA
jgi:hypothetical protein